MLLQDVMAGAAIVFVLLIVFDIVFVVLTRVPDSPDTSGCLVRLIRPIAFLIAQVFILTFCAVFGSLGVLAIPNNPIVARYPELTSEHVNQVMKSAAGPEAYVFVFLFIAGMPATIWLLMWLSGRIHDKTWDEPGDLVTRIMRAAAILFSYLGWIVLGAALLVALVVLGAPYLSVRVDNLPVLIRRIQTGDLRISKDNELIIVGGFFMAGAALYALTTLIQTIRRIGAMSWYTVEGDIQNSRVRTIVSGSGKSRSTRHELSATYDYEVEGQRYTGQRVMIGSQSGNYAQAWLLWKQFPAGARVPIYYNPRIPDSTVLVRGIMPMRLLTSIVWIVLIGLAGFMMFVPVTLP